MPLGRTVAKWRCLELRGWRVVSVPIFQWEQLKVWEWWKGRGEERSLTVDKGAAEMQGVGAAGLEGGERTHFSVGAAESLQAWKGMGGEGK